MRLIFLGPPGAGKGTIAKQISELRGLIQVSTGDLFRENIRNETAVGRKARSYVDSGELVPDGMVIDVLRERIVLDDCHDGFILDGFPRTIPQADALEAHPSVDIDRVINFVVSDHVIVQRLSGRRTCSECGAIFHVTNIPPKRTGICDRCDAKLMQREDDKEEAIRNRLVVYKRQTQPLIAFYRDRALLADIDGELPEIGLIVAAVERVLDGV